MKIPGVAQFITCTLTDQELADAVAEGLCKMYQPPFRVPDRHIPAQPNNDFDLLVAELIMRFMEKEDMKKWTLSTEALPDEEERVLLYCTHEEWSDNDSDRYGIGRLIRKTGREKHRFFNADGVEIWGEPVKILVSRHVYWMPLPDKPTTWQHES